MADVTGTDAGGTMMNRRNRLRQVRRAAFNHRQLQVLEDVLWVKPVVKLLPPPATIVGKRQPLPPLREDDDVNNQQSDIIISNVNAPLQPYAACSGKPSCVHDDNSSHTTDDDLSRDVVVVPNEESISHISNSLHDVTSSNIRDVSTKGSDVMRARSRLTWLDGQMLTCTPVSPRFLEPKMDTSLGALKFNLQLIRRAQELSSSSQPKVRKLRMKGSKIAERSKKLMERVNPSAIAKEPTGLTLRRVKFILQPTCDSYYSASITSSMVTLFPSSAITNGIIKKKFREYSTELEASETTELDRFLAELHHNRMRLQDRIEWWFQSTEDCQ